MVCNKCGAELIPNSKFCRNCGAAVEMVNENDVQNENVQHQQYQQPEQYQQQVYPQQYQQYQQPEQYQQQGYPQQYQQYQQPEQYQQQGYPQQYQQYQQPEQYQQPVQPQPYQYQQPVQYQQPGYPGGYYQDPAPPPPKKPGVLKKVLLISGISVAGVALIGVAVFVLLSFLGSPSTKVARSIVNLNKELEERISDTPLEMFGILGESLESGTVAFDFEYNTFDWWSSYNGVIALHTDAKKGEYALETELNIDGFEIDFDLYTNRERLAFRIGQLDNNFYGINYETFSDDFRSLANLLELDRDEIDMVTDMIDMINDLINIGEGRDNPYKAYGDIMVDFVKSIDVISEKAEINVGGSTVKADRIEYFITEEMIIELLENLVDELENDENIRTMFDGIEEMQASSSWFYDKTSYDTAIRELRNEIRELERSLKGEVVISFYIGSGNRLLRLEFDIYFEHGNGNFVEFESTLELGSSAHDIWTLEMTAYNDWYNEYETITIEWEMKETSRGGETVIRGISDDSWGVSTYEIILSWHENGNISFAVSEGRNTMTLFSGVYTKEKDGFKLSIDDPFSSIPFINQSLKLEMTATTRDSGHIKEISYINISEWDKVLIEKLEELFIDDSYTQYPYPDPFDPFPPAGGTGHDEMSLTLQGRWEFISGDGTYFFWTSSDIYFWESGEVHNYDHDDYGRWYFDGDYLYVTDSFGVTYEFVILIIGDTLTIIDSDGDTGVFIRTGGGGG